MTDLLVEDRREGGVALLFLNRPEKRNAISNELRAELIEALERLTKDESVRAVVISGNGAAFCAGGDISGMRDRLETAPGRIAANGWNRQRTVHYAQTLLHDMPKPVIAAVNGSAYGLGADLALACDFVLASETAKFSWSYGRRGLIPDGGGMYFLPRRVGLPKAKELIFTSRVVPAAEALEAGIADRLVEADVLVESAVDWARELSAGSSTAIALTKSIMDSTFESTMDEVFAAGSLSQAICYTTDEHRDSVREFLERKKG